MIRRRFGPLRLVAIFVLVAACASTPRQTVTYDASTGRYSFAVLTLVRIGGLLTIAAFGIFLWYERKRATP